MLLTVGVLALGLSGPASVSADKAAIILAAADNGGIVLKPPKSRQQEAVAKREKGSPPPPLKHMELQAQYAGPLQSTIVQRWRDPVDGTICYTYLPILVRHAPAAENGLVDYGANQIGSISCFQPR